MARYEIKSVQPPADVLKKLADIFNTSIDYLVYGDAEQKPNKALKTTNCLPGLKRWKKWTVKTNLPSRILLMLLSKEVNSRILLCCKSKEPDDIGFFCVIAIMFQSCKTGFFILLKP